MTYAEAIEALARGAEGIHYDTSRMLVSIGEFGWGDGAWDRDDDEPFGFGALHWPNGKPKTGPTIGAVYPWHVARDWLDYEYNPTYGSPECHAVWAYTTSHVIAAWQYDGVTGLYSIPRNPADGYGPRLVGR